ncbi:hypothetical protein E4T56_gene17938 [Termitomyces sp. T112]|nr:hypothetical protein E4T56_gene17938 [Termitomyces sp. T112]KAH0591258.1 hypothetical protein H2248_001348 [Termitomyces sp. 'cryptogamus']
MNAESPESSAAAAAIDTQQLQAGPELLAECARKAKTPSVRRACVACHSGKTRCSEHLPCQSCIKRGLASSCAYPDPDTPFPAAVPPPPMYATLQQQYYSDYNGAYTGASTSTFRPAKRPRPLTDQETAAIRNFTRGDFFIGNNAPVRIDPRLPVRLTLGDGDQVHFTIGEAL